MRDIRWLRVTGVLMLLLLAITSLATAQGWGFFGGSLFGDVEEEEPEEDPKFAPDGIPIGFSLVSENRNLELYLDTEKAQLLVRDKNTQNMWRTNPDLSETTLNVGGLWEQHLQSQVIIQYTDDKKRNKKTTNNVNQQAVVTYEPIQRGVRITFHMEALGFQIPVEYRLGSSYLEARIPQDRLLETGSFALVTIELVPFFGAAIDTDTGYLVIPDSSGALVNFKEDHPSYSRQFQEFAYGPDEVRFAASTQEYFLSFNQSRRQVPGPYFGIVNGSQAFLGLVTEGEFDVKINAAPSGYIVPFYRASAEFQVRKEYTAYLARTRTVPTTESQAIRTDRAVRWYLLNEEDANYIGMANTYREYLKQKYNVVGRLGLVEDEAPIHIRIVNSVLKEGLVLDELINMTTFAQARSILEQMKAEGINNIDVTLVGWTKNGVDGVLPRHGPVGASIGGAKGLQEFTAWARENGIKVFLEDNFVNAVKGNGGFSTRTDVVRTAAKVPINLRGNFIISPLAAYDKFAKKAIPELAQLGVSGMDFKKFGEMLIYDRNEYYRAEREDTAKAWLSIAALTKREMGNVVIQGGNLFYLAVADKIYNAPLDESTHVFVDHSIPFYQIVVHGLVPLYSYPSNLRNDPRKEYLRMIEYGMLPVFELTWENSSLLRETSYALLFSSQYTTWMDTVKQEYQEVNVEMGYLQRLNITDHIRHDENVFETVYSDGTRVIVNYNHHEITVGDLSVPALDYLLIKGVEGR